MSYIFFCCSLNHRFSPGSIQGIVIFLCLCFGLRCTVWYLAVCNHTSGWRFSTLGLQSNSPQVASPFLRDSALGLLIFEGSCIHSFSPMLSPPHQSQVTMVSGRSLDNTHTTLAPLCLNIRRLSAFSSILVSVCSTTILQILVQLRREIKRCVHLSILMGQTVSNCSYCLILANC